MTDRFYSPDVAKQVTNRRRHPAQRGLLCCGAVLLIGGVLLLRTVNLQAQTTPAAEENWPQWRGPWATGVSPSGDPPAEWSETKNIKWKVKLPGSGTSTPIIWGNQIFIQTAIPKPEAEAEATGDADCQEQEAQPQNRRQQPNQPGRRRGGRGGFGRGRAPTTDYQFALICLDRQTGDTLWQQNVREERPHEGHHNDHGYASYSPITDGQHIFAYFGSRGLHCYDFQGNRKWEKDLGRMRTRNGFGEGSSPALFGDIIVVNWDHEGDDFIVALNKQTGEELWRQPRDEPTTWATPLIVEHEGQVQVVTSGTNKVRSYDLKTGEPIWECRGLTDNAIPSPVTKDGIVYLTSGFRGSAMLAIRLGQTGNLTGTDAIVWSHSRNTPYVPSPLLYDDRLYFFAGNNAILSSFDINTGQAVMGPERLNGLSGVYASPVGAGGRVYLVGRNGVSLVIRHADSLDVLATNRLDERIDASPAVVGNELYLRGEEHLYCIAEK